MVSSDTSEDSEYASVNDEVHQTGDTSTSTDDANKAEGNVDIHGEGETIVF